MKVFIGLLFLIPFSFLAQRTNPRYQSELGFLVGGSYYVGDLNPFRHFYKNKLAAQLIYRFNINPRLSFRSNLSYGNVEADDADSKSNILVNRNLNFQSSITELAAGLEFHYFPFRIGSEKYPATAYLLTQLGVFRMNPTTTFNDEKYELQSLGTEGQGSSLSNKEPYSLTQLCIPLGVGFKMSLGKRASLNFEFGFRKTFTDYLDDVGSDNYIDPSLLSLENGPLAAELSNQSLDGSIYGKRGTASTSDWYSFFGVMFTFRLGNPTKCNQP